MPNRKERRRRARRDAEVLRIARKCLDFCAPPPGGTPSENRRFIQSVAEELTREGLLSKAQLKRLKLWHQAADGADLVRAQRLAKQRAEAEAQAVRDFVIGGLPEGEPPGGVEVG